MRYENDPGGKQPVKVLDVSRLRERVRAKGGEVIGKRGGQYFKSRRKKRKWSCQVRSLKGASGQGEQQREDE